MLKTNITLDEEFENLYNIINRSGDGKKLLDLTGVGRKQLDIGYLSHAYFQEHWDEASTDPNANANNMGPINYGLEISKPQLKLIGLYLLHRYIRKDFSLEYADQLMKNLVKGDYYFHDSSGVGIQLAYCYAFSTQWIMSNGIPWGQLKSLPPKKAASFIAQVVEVTMEMSMEYAGAIAPADVLVHYAYYSKKEGLSSKEIENHLQSLVHIFNKQFRPGGQCVTEDTEVLTPQGFRNKDTLHIGDEIYVWDDGRLRVQEVQEVNIYDHDGIMHEYRGRDVVQTVTPNHMVMRKKFPIKGEDYVLKPSTEIFQEKSMPSFPVAMKEIDLPEYPISNDLLKMCIFVLTDGNIDDTHQHRISIYKSPKRWGGEEIRRLMNSLSLVYSHKETTNGFEGNEGTIEQWRINRKSSEDIISLLEHTKKDIPQWMLQLDQRQSKIVIDYWTRLDGHNGAKTQCQCDNMMIADKLQHIAFRAGYGTRIHYRKIGNNKKDTLYLRIYIKTAKYASSKKEVEYKGQVWCPTTEAGIVVYRKEGKLFISGNSPFTNISIFDQPNLENLFEQVVYEDGSVPDKEEVMRVQRIFLNWFCKGDPSTGLPYRFPIVTTNFALDEENKILDNPFLSEIARYNTKLGCLNIHSGSHGKLAMCCRFINDPARMRQFKTDTFGNGGLNIGSHRVITLNLPRIAYEAKGNWNTYLRIVETRMEEIRDLLIIHRERILGKRIEQNFLKSFQYHLSHPSHFFSTFGFVGVYEAISAMGLDIQSKKGHDKAREIIMLIDFLAAEYSDNTGYAFNTEEIPAEGAAVTLCRKDKVLYPDEVKVDMYSNQFLPLHLDVPMLERISQTGVLMKDVSGGSILHINIDENIENPEIMETLMRKIIEKGVNHFGINYGFSICPKDSGHNSAGIHDKCPICGEVIEDWMTRVVGYFVPVSKWQPTRREVDFKSRHWYKEV